MLIQVKRFEYGEYYTISKMYLDGVYECFVLEDKVREVDGQPVAAWKIPAETAIPKGTYKVVIDFSNHFQKDLPHLLDVPGFEGVRIHPGNSDKDTEGCLLLGTTWTGGDFVGQSRLAFESFFQKLSAVQGEVQLQIGDSVSDFS